MTPADIDQIVAASAIERDWELVVPLPFGRALNLAINAHAHSLEDADALLGVEQVDVTRRAIGRQRLDGIGTRVGDVLDEQDGRTGGHHRFEKTDPGILEPVAT